METGNSVKVKLKQIDSLKNDQNWLEDESSCQLIVDTVSLLDGSSLENLYSLTPFILRLTDDYKPENKLKGLICLTTLMNVYTINDLQSANFHQLFWQTLKSLLYNDDIELAKCLIPTLIRFIDKFSMGRTELDDCFNQLVKNVLLSSNKPLKLIYMDGVYQFLLIWPDKLIKFTKSILQITQDTVQDVINQETYNLVALSCDILLIIINKTGKLSYIFAGQLLLSFIKAKFNLKETNLNLEQSSDLSKKMDTCLLSLNTYNPKLLTDYCDLIKDKLSQYGTDTNFVINFLMNIKRH